MHRAHASCAWVGMRLSLSAMSLGARTSSTALEAVSEPCSPTTVDGERETPSAASAERCAGSGGGVRQGVSAMEARAERDVGGGKGSHEPDGAGSSFACGDSDVCAAQRAASRAARRAPAR